MDEPEVDGLETIEQDDVTYVSWRTRTDFDYLAVAGDRVKVCTGTNVYERGRIYRIDDAGFDMDVGPGMIFKGVRINYADVVYIEKL